MISISKNHISIAALSFLLLFVSSNYSQENYFTISGLIKDKVTGEVLTGASILLYRDSVNTAMPPFRGITANQYGYYAIPRLQSGTYIIVARSLGYTAFINKISLSGPSRTIRLDIEVQQENINLQEVIIKGEKTGSPDISSVNLSPDMISQLPSISGEVDLFKSLQMLPGITINNELSTGLYIRGSTPDQTLTLVDGVIVYNPTHLGNFASTFNSDALQDIKLIKGAFPAEYGGRLSSVLDIKLRNGSKESNKVILGLGMINSRLTLEGPLNDNATYIFSGRKMYYDALQNIMNASENTPRYNFYDLSSKLSFSASGNDIISISTILSNDHIYNPSGETINYDIQWQNATVSLNWSQLLSNSRFSNTSLSYVNYKFKSIINDTSSKSISSDYYSLSQLQDFLLKKDVEFFLTEDNLAKLGFDLALHNYELDYSNVYSYLIEKSSGNENTNFNYELAGYFQSEWQLTSRLKLNSGGRFYYFSAQKYLQFEPRLSAVFSINENVSLKGAFAVANQYLHLIIRNDISLPTDLWYPSTKVISPSNAKQYILGVDSYFSDRQYEFSVEGYYKDMKNLYEFKDNLIYNPQNSIVDLFTRGAGEAYGIEFFLNKSAGDLTGWIGYTLSWTKRKFEELNAGRIFYPRFDRRNDISVILTYKLIQNLSFGLTWMYASGQGFNTPVSQYRIGGVDLDPVARIQFDYNERNSYKLPDYHKMDVSMTYKFDWGRAAMEVSLSIYNVYNRKNPFAYYAVVAQPGSGELVLSPKYRSISLFPFLPALSITLKL